MAPRIRTALLGTAMASGLLLSPLAAHALPPEEGAITTISPEQLVPTTEAASDAGAATAANAEGSQDSGQEPADAPVAESAVGDADAGDTETGQAPAEVQPAPEESVENDSPATEVQAPDLVEGNDPNDSSPVESQELTVEEGSIAAEDPGQAEAAPSGSDASADTGSQVADPGAAPGGTAEPGNAEETGVGETGGETPPPLIDEEPAAEPDIPNVTMPEGSEAWDEKQWNDFLDTDEGAEFIEEYVNALMAWPPFLEIVDILTDFVITGDETYLDELWEYLNELFPDNPEWAQEAFDGILAGIGAWDAAEPEVPEQPQEQGPEIKPAATVTKPVVSKKPVAQAVAKPIVESQRHELADTGSNGSLVIGGLGVVLLVGGVLTLGMRRRQKRL